MNQEMKV